MKKDRVVLKLKESIELSDILYYAMSSCTKHNPKGTERSNRLTKAICKNYPPYLYYYKQNFTELTITLVKMTREQQDLYHKRNENRLITFAPIDAKCGHYSVLDTDWDGARTKNNYAVLLEAEKEYLELLGALQERMRKKYEPKLISSNDDIVLTSDEIDDMRKKVPSKHNYLYYT